MTMDGSRWQRCFWIQEHWNCYRRSALMMFFSMWACKLNELLNDFSTEHNDGAPFYAP